MYHPWLRPSSHLDIESLTGYAAQIGLDATSSRLTCAQVTIALLPLMLAAASARDAR